MRTDVGGATVLVVGGGYEGKRRALERMSDLGAELVVADEAGHWSSSLVDSGIAKTWFPVEVSGDSDIDAAAVVAALDLTGIRPDGVLTFWENSITVAARVAATLGLPGNPPDAVDVARSKVRTRELAAELGLPSPRATRVRSLDELYAAAHSIGFPAVVKPEFGASAVGCVRVDALEDLPGVYALVRTAVSSEQNEIFRAGNDLLFEEYLDGVEFDVDLVMHEGACVFSSVSQNWPTAEPSFQETGLHCPPDHDRRAVRRLVTFCIETVCAFGLHHGVLHVEGKCTSRGPRIVEVNARMGGGRISEIVERVWGVDLVEAQLRASLACPPKIDASRRPRCAVVNPMVYAPVSGFLVDLPFARRQSDNCVALDLGVDIGDQVCGPEEVFATHLAEAVIVGRNLRQARAASASFFRDPPVVSPFGTERGLSSGPRRP